MNDSNQIVKIGIVGAGEFAGFASKAFLKVDGIKITAIFDIHSAAVVKNVRCIKC